MSNIRSFDNTQVKGRFNTLLYVIGWISAIISVVRLPFVFGVLGVVMGIICSKNGSKAAVSLIVASLILMAVGLLFNGVIYNNLRHFMGF
jgi:hypothetical protein